MKKTILLFTTLLSLNAAQIAVTAEQEKDWEITTEILTASSITPQATLFVEVVIPPQLLKTLSLPNEVTITALHVNLYDSVKRGDALVSVSSPQWLETQKNAISSSIDYGDALQTDQRKQMLCDEQIIAKKECIASHSMLLRAQNTLKASKELLRTYGATPKIIDSIIKELKVYSTLTLYSSVDGNIIESNVAIGKSVNAFEPLFTIKKSGNLWLEGALTAKDAAALQNGDAITITIDKQQLQSTVLNIAPFMNTNNQTRNVRFSTTKETTLLPGLRTSATLYLHKDSIKVPKKALIQDGDNSIVFIKNGSNYSSVTVTVLSQKDDYYYLKPQAELQKPIAVNSVLILKSMMENSNE